MYQRISEADMTQATLDTTVSGLQGNPISPAAPQTGQLLVWSGTAWVPASIINGNLTVNGLLAAPSVNGNLTATGNLAGANVNATGTVQGANFQNAQGINTITGRAFMQTQDINQIYTITSSSAVMAGFGSTYQITPRVSGIVLVSAYTLVSNSIANQNTNMNINYNAVASQAAPVQGAAGTGNSLPGVNMTNLCAEPGALFPLQKVGLVTGLTIGATYWFDFVIWLGGSGPANYNYWNMTLAEL
jgi:hypothetical protein